MYRLLSSSLVGFLFSIHSFADVGKSILPKAKVAETKEEAKPSLAAFAGVAAGNESQRSSVNYGVEYAFQPIIPVAFGVQLSGYSSSSAGNKADLTRTKFFLTGNYNFGGDLPVIKYSFVGAEAGPVFDNVNHRHRINFGWAPRLGFDIPLSGMPQEYTLGAQANYLFVAGSRPDAFSVNGVLKYWF